MNRAWSVGHCLVLVGVLMGSFSVWSGISMAKEGNKEGTQEVDAPKSSAQEVEVPVVEVRDQAIKSAGTGTLHLEQASPSASRLGLSIREIPATVEIVDQTLLQERGLRTISEAVEGTTGVTVGDSRVTRPIFLCGDSRTISFGCSTTG